MELPEDIVSVVVSFLNLPQLDLEHRFHRLRERAKKLCQYSPDWLTRIGVKTVKYICLFPEFQDLGERLSLERIEKERTLQCRIMRRIHSLLLSQIERRMEQLQALYIRRFYRGQDRFVVLWDRRSIYNVLVRSNYWSREITREEFDYHYNVIISNQRTDLMDDWNRPVSGCIDISENSNHSFCLTI